MALTPLLTSSIGGTSKPSSRDSIKARALALWSSRCAGHLMRDELRIQATPCKQLLVRAGLNNVALVERNNLISASNGRESMRNHERRSVRH